MFLLRLNVIKQHKPQSSILRLNHVSSYKTLLEESRVTVVQDVKWTVPTWIWRLCSECILTGFLRTAMYPGGIIIMYPDKPVMIICRLMGLLVRNVWPLRHGFTHMCIDYPLLMHPRHSLVSPQKLDLFNIQIWSENDYRSFQNVFAMVFCQ